MGIDKGLPRHHSPIVIKEGCVYNYGRVDIDQHTHERRTGPPYWVIEHHDYAKWFTRFETAQELQDAIDGMKPSTEYATPEKQFVEEVSSAIAAIFQHRVIPFPFWDDPAIDEQVHLIIADALRRHHAFLEPANPLPTDSPNAQITPAIDRSIRDAELPNDVSVAMSFVEDVIAAIRTGSQQEIALFIEAMDEVRHRSQDTSNDNSDRTMTT